MHQGLLRKLACVWNRFLHALILPGGAAAGLKQNASYAKLSSMLNAIPDLMFELDAEGRHWDFRVLRHELLVVPSEQLMGRTVRDVMPSDAADSVMQALGEAAATGFSHGTHIHLPTPVGDRWFEVSIALKESVPGEGQRFIALSRDITERKLRQLEAEHLAFFDRLTELPNRHALKERLQSELRAQNKQGQFDALLFLDLDNFKALNDQKGHAYGDMLLRLLAKRLRASVSDTDLVMRWGGDEFVILLENLGDTMEQAQENAVLICERIAAKTNMPYELNDYVHTCQVSIGIKIFKNTAADLEEVIQQADQAMYEAKKSLNLRYAFSGECEQVSL